MTPPPTTITAEGGGFVVTCACHWLRWLPTEKDARAVGAAHEKKCKTCAGGEG